MPDPSTENLAARLDAQAALRPDTPAVTETRRGADVATSFAALTARVGAAAAGLRAAGIGPGDRVLLMVPVSTDLYVALLAAWRAGAVACIVDPSLGLAGIDRCVARIAPAAMIGGALARAARRLGRGARRIRRAHGVPRLETLGRGGPPPAPAPVGDDTPALLTFTSGSTGEPKAIVRTHGLLSAQLAALRDAIALEPGQVDLITLPVFALANLACGVSSVIAAGDLRRPGAIDGDLVRRQMVRCGVDRCAASPAFFERLLDAAGPRGEPLPLRRAFTGGAPVFPALLARLAAALPPGGSATAVYGSTEAEPIAEIAHASIRGPDLDAMRRGAGLLAGDVVPSLALRIMRPAWGTPLPEMGAAALDARCAETGAAGEIIVAGRHVVPGYLDGAGDEETKIRVGATVWHRTGDLGRVDESGRLWLLGRASAAVHDDRGTLYPFAVEAAAMAEPDVRRAALARHAGERVLVIEPRAAGAAPDPGPALEAALGATVDRVLVVERVPVDRRHNAKVDYPALGRLLERRLGPDDPAATPARAPEKG